MPRGRYDDDDDEEEENFGRERHEEQSSSSESEEEFQEEEEETTDYPSLLEIGAQPPKGFFRPKHPISYGLSLQAVVEDLQSGAATFEEVVDLGQAEIKDGTTIHVRALGMISPVVLGIYIPELGEEDAVHLTPNGSFHYVFPMGTHANDKDHYLGSIGHLSRVGRKTAAEHSLMKHVKLSRPRGVDVATLWGTRIADLEDPSNPDLETIEKRGMTIFGAQHPVLNVLVPSDYSSHNETSFHMPTKEFRAGWKDMRALARHLSKFYGQRITVFIQPVFTDRLYSRSDPQQWKNVKGAHAFFADEFDEEGAWKQSMINVSLELVLE